MSADDGRPQARAPDRATVPDFDIFVSYARANRALIEPLVEMLREGGATVWIDASDIPPGSQWMNEIDRAIGSSSAVVCLISPEFVSSQICLHEMNFAHECGKRVVPVIVSSMGDPDRALLPPWVQSINWLFVDTDVQESAHKILRTARSDLEWAREHARLLVRAKEWEEHDKPRSRLLKGRDITAAEASLLVGRNVDEPQPVHVQREFVAASRRARSRLVRAGASLAAIIAVSALALSVVAVRQRDAARTAQRRAELALNRSDFERLGAASSNDDSIRDAADTAIATYEAGLAAELSESQSIAAMLTVAADGNRPLAQYVGRADSQQYSGGQQGFGVSGDGSTMAFLALTGELEVVDLWDLSSRLSTSALRLPGAITEQVALDYSGDRLLYAGVDFQWDGGDSPARYTAMIHMYDISTSPPDEILSGTVELASGIFAIGIGPDAKIVIVGEDGPITVVDTGTEPWQVETVGETINFAAADYGTANFSVDGNRLCARGPISGFYQVQPWRLISSTNPGTGCIPEPCGGSAANRIEVSDDAFQKGTCVDPRGRVVRELASCSGSCGLVRGLEFSDGPLIAVPAAAAAETFGGFTYAVPGPAGPQFVSIDFVGVIRVFRSDREGVLPTVSTFELPDASLTPSGQSGDGRRYVATDGTLLEVALGTEPIEIGKFDLGEAPANVLRSHLVDKTLVTVTEIGDENVVTIRPDNGRPHPLDVVAPDAYSFQGTVAAFAVGDEIQLWDLTEEASIRAIPAGDGPWCAVALSESRTAIAGATCPDSTAGIGRLRVWDLTGEVPRIVDDADLKFAGASALGVSDDGSVATVAHGVGQVEVRVDGAWVQPVSLMTEPGPTNDYHAGWTTVDRTGHWMLTRRHGEGIKLWLVAEGGVAEVAQLLFDDPIDPPVDVAFGDTSLALTWSTGFSAASFAAWDLSADWVLAGLCPLLGDFDPLPSSCPEAIEVQRPARTAAAPVAVTVPQEQVVEPVREVERLNLPEQAPVSVAVGADGAVWVGGDSVARIDPIGVVTYPIPRGGTFYNLTPWEGGVAVNGFLWLGFANGNGNVSQYLPDTQDPATSRSADGPMAVANGSLWAFSPKVPALLEITPSGAIQEHTLPPEYVNAKGAAATAEPDGTVAFVLRFVNDDSVRSVIADVEQDGLIELSEFGNVNVQQLTVDSSGVLWIYVLTTSELLRIDSDGNRQVADLTNIGGVLSLAIDGDGVAWFTTQHGIGSASFNPALGTIQTSHFPIDGSENLRGLAIDNDGAGIWVVDSSTDDVIHFSVNA